jgi:hypothetical protein
MSCPNEYLPLHLPNSKAEIREISDLHVSRTFHMGCDCADLIILDPSLSKIYRFHEKDLPPTC